MSLNLSTASLPSGSVDGSLHVCTYLDSQDDVHTLVSIMASSRLAHDDNPTQAPPGKPTPITARAQRWRRPCVTVASIASKSSIVRLYGSWDRA